MAYLDESGVENLSADIKALADESFAVINDGVELIIATQSTATSAWTGITKDSQLYDGKKILLFLGTNGNRANATLNLTLSDGQTTGAKSVYGYNGRQIKHHALHRSDIVVELVYVLSKDAWFNPTITDRVPIIDGGTSYVGVYDFTSELVVNETPLHVKAFSWGPIASITFIGASKARSSDQVIMTLPDWALPFGNTAYFFTGSVVNTAVPLALNNSSNKKISIWSMSQQTGRLTFTLTYFTNEFTENA